MLSPADLTRIRTDHTVTRASAPYCRISDKPPARCDACQLLAYLAHLEATLAKQKKT